ncbi:hypothetical protein M404DRAFT_927412 [Pisolithus tinctorius Marx 270]|uniref:BTB domain-containing protein n=1 Tax=Pisolithus tinctorius Marx 270 TaxID=870435 RepID=A0A0C3NN57_PISTI|nr:hypothetical protein M404DRAFT_927412 [Pisolithus tinctorius Marx 270]
MECEVSSAVLATKASWPFDDPNAEVILRSSDNVDFRVFRCNLSLASPVFKDMFTLGAPVHGEHPPNPSSLPVVPLSETGSALDALLRLIYPLTTPKLDSVGDIKALVAAVVKYDLIEPAIYRATNLIIRQYLQSSPVSLYAIACLCGWRNLAERAARETLKIKDFGRVRTYVAELEDMSAGDYYRLLDYHRACATAAHTTDIQTELHIAFPLLRSEVGEDIDIPALLCNCPMHVLSHQWFHEYMTVTREGLLRRPDPSTVKDRSFLGVLEGTTVCSRMALHLDQISDIYARAVDGAISKVKLEFKQ